ncbi:MAG: adenylate kinase family protein [Candidatus Thermoplasmatota archaeon]|nr:adenylate kinase family protein [Candidatus Thermoplasmatota archaeon]
MIIAISGTPGCGKTSVAKVLRKQKYSVIDLKKFAIENGCVSGVDKKRDTREIDVPKLNRKLEPAVSEMAKDDHIFIEGHLSHLLDFVDAVAILRCAPSALAARLKNKRWRKAKVVENLQAEALGIITFEALRLRKCKGDKIFEIDVTDSSPEETASKILRIISSRPPKSGARISWSKDIMENAEILYD